MATDRTLRSEQRGNVPARIWFSVLFIATELLPFLTMHSAAQPVPTCVKTFCDRCRLDQISSANFACNKRVEILKLEFSLPVWLIEHTNHRYRQALRTTLTGSFSIGRSNFRANFKIYLLTGVCIIGKQPCRSAKHYFFKTVIVW